VKSTTPIALALCILLAAFLAAQEPQDFEQQMLEYMEKYATPGEHHRHLEKLVGNWTTATTFWAAPGAPPAESTGAAEHRMILGGRFLVTSYKGNFMDIPFEGTGTVAYDRYKEKYVETWVDNMGTMVMVSEGTCDGTGKERTVAAEFTDPMTGADVAFRSVYRIIDEDNYVLEMHSSLPEGGEFQLFEIAHTRAD
jgi:hypothetical protein